MLECLSAAEDPGAGPDRPPSSSWSGSKKLSPELWVVSAPSITTYWSKKSDGSRCAWLSIDAPAPMPAVESCQKSSLSMVKSIARLSSMFASVATGILHSSSVFFLFFFFFLPCLVLSVSFQHWRIGCAPDGRSETKASTVMRANLNADFRVVGRGLDAVCAMRLCVLFRDFDNSRCKSSSDVLKRENWLSYANGCHIERRLWRQGKKKRRTAGK